MYSNTDRGRESGENVNNVDLPVRRLFGLHLNSHIHSHNMNSSTRAYTTQSAHIEVLRWVTHTCTRKGEISTVLSWVKCRGISLTLDTCSVVCVTLQLGLVKWMTRLRWRTKRWQEQHRRRKHATVIVSYVRNCTWVCVCVRVCMCVCECLYLLVFVGVRIGWVHVIIFHVQNENKMQNITSALVHWSTPIAYTHTHICCSWFGHRAFRIQLVLRIEDFIIMFLCND